MRIAHIARSEIPGYAADSVQVMKMCEAFSAIGHDVTLFVPNYARGRASTGDVFSRYGVRGNFTVEKVPAAPVRGRVHRFAWQSVRAARNWPADVVYARGVKSAFFLARSRLPVIVELHAIAEGLDGWIFSLMCRLLEHENLLRVVVLSEALKRAVSRRYAFPEDKILVAPSGADAAAPESERAGSDRHVMRAGYTGQLFEGKGMEIISELAVLCPDIEFHIIGGLDHDIASWKARTQSHGNIRFHGYLPHPQAVGSLQGFDVLLAPYQRHVEGGGTGTNLAPWMSPLKIFEYMSTGRPIVCSDLPVLREVLSSGKTAIMCSPDDPREWQKALELIRQDPNMGRRLGDAARRTFEANYSWSARARNVLAGLEEKIPR